MSTRFAFAAAEIVCFREGGIHTNVTADNTIRFSQRSRDDINLIHGRNVLCHTSSVRAIHADSVNLVKEGQGAILASQSGNFLDWPDTAAHTVDGLEANELW